MKLKHLHLQPIQHQFVLQNIFSSTILTLMWSKTAVATLVWRSISLFFSKSSGRELFGDRNVLLHKDTDSRGHWLGLSLLHELYNITIQNKVNFILIRYGFILLSSRVNQAFLEWNFSLSHLTAEVSLAVLSDNMLMAPSSSPSKPFRENQNVSGVTFSGETIHVLTGVTA